MNIITSVNRVDAADLEKIVNTAGTLSDYWEAVVKWICIADDNAKDPNNQKDEDKMNKIYSSIASVITNIRCLILRLRSLESAYKGKIEFDEEILARLSDLCDNVHTIMGDALCRDEEATITVINSIRNTAYTTMSELKNTGKYHEEK